MRDAVSTRALGRVFWLRALVVASLLGVAAVIGWWAYTILRESESTQADSLYESVSVAALVNTQKSFTRASKGATTLASMFSGAHPTETDWPNAALGEFAERAAQLAEIANVNDVGFGPVLRPDQVAAWETFAFNLWDNDPLIPPNRAFTPPAGPGLPPGRGIWNINPNIPPPGSIYLDDLSGNTTWGDSDTLRILLPTAQHKGENLLGLNSYPSQVLGPVIEKTLLCAMEKDIGAARTECQAVVTLPQGIVKAFSDYKAPALVVLTPISIVGDDGATKAVGIAYASLDWSILLADTVPSFVGELDIVLEAEGATGGEKVLFTFVFKKGDNGLALALWQGNGDLHDPRYSSKRKTGLLYQPSLVGIAESSQYTISFYPRKAFYDKYQSNSPIYFSVGGVSLIALVSLIFLLYDFAVSRQSEEQKVVLDTKRRYVRFISHEIRTPLNTVRMGLKLFDMELVSSLKMLKEKSPAEAVLIMTKTIEGWAQLTDDTLSNTEAAVDVLNDLLNYDKIESGTLRLEFSSVPIWQVVKKTTACFAMQAREKNVSLTLTGTLWDGRGQYALTQYQALHVVGDSMRISQVLRNLMSNAIKFTPDSGTISVHAEWLPEALVDAEIDMTPQESQQWLSYARAGAVRISVTDTGAGLSPGQLLEIGAEGVQFNANQLQAGQGSGLGLFISKGICAQHGGTFDVTSQGLDQGATFSILLPLFSIASEEGDAAIETDAAAAVEFRRPQRVLVVDDAISNRKMLLRILRTKQYVCEDAEDGRVAVEKYAAAVARGEPFDAILSDYEMPVMNGPDSVWEMRRLGCKCFIAGITGNVMKEDIDLFKEHGADAVLAKPLDTDVWESLLRNFRPRETPYGTTLCTGSSEGRGGTLSKFSLSSSASEKVEGMGIGRIWGIGGFGGSIGRGLEGMRASVRSRAERERQRERERVHPEGGGLGGFEVV